MSYKIVIDSCGELLDEWKKDPRFESVALTLSVGGENIIDDENFDQASFLKKVADCPECPKSACPSPERYMRAFDCDADHVYAVRFQQNLVARITVLFWEKVFCRKKILVSRFMCLIRNRHLSDSP